MHLRHRDRSLGQGLVEFGLVLPIFLAILIGMVDVGRAVWANNSVANAAREAARFASVHGGSCEDLTSIGCTSAYYCPVGTAVSTAAIPAASSSCPYPSNSKQAIYDTATSYLVAGGTGITVTACYFDPAATNSCTGNTDSNANGSSGNNARGKAVTVVVASQVPMIIGSLIGVGTINVSASSTMLINH
jgi:Flp pilus assembly protein TadG